VLIRVTADLSVPDGSKIEDLGINFRRMTRAILARCVDPRIDEITSVYDTLRLQLAPPPQRQPRRDFARCSKLAVRGRLPPRASSSRKRTRLRPGKRRRWVPAKACSARRIGRWRR
jgi:hypothetical protein